MPSLRLTGRVLLLQPRVLAWLPPLAWAAMIFALSSFQPTLDGFDLLSLGGFTQNLAHPAVFGILALLLAPVAARVPGPGGRPWARADGPAVLWVVVAVTLYGFSDELHQSTVEGRDASLFDVLSDAVGALATMLVIRYLGRDDATESGLLRRLAWGIAAACGAAGLSTLWGHTRGEGLWPF